MNRPSLSSFFGRLKTIVIGGTRDPDDPGVFRHLSLIAFFAWVGLGADGLSSSAYGPAEMFIALREHPHLGIIVTLGAVLTIFIISASYSQIIELFPGGGGGYLVASKLLSPTAGMVAGSALLIDYVLTITISIASGSDAIFSFLPLAWQPYKLHVALLGVAILIVLNMRGAKESVVPLVPIFLVFIATHALAIGYSFLHHFSEFPQLMTTTAADFRATHRELGLAGMMFLLMRAYSMGAGTYTGIEAVSNGLSILREPRIQTAKRTMQYMSISLAITVLGLMLSYLFYNVDAVPGKTLNAVLFENMTADWTWGHGFVLVTLLSEAAILFIAAQAGFLDGPRVLANMALDRWMPTRFATLSDRLVTQNGIFIMGAAAVAMMILTKGSVGFLVVLYSINVFLTFVLSQLGMVRHWWQERRGVVPWKKRLLVNGTGLWLCSFILISVIILKFDEGGWITLVVTGALIIVAWLIKRHYDATAHLLQRLDSLVLASTSDITSVPGGTETSLELAADPTGKTAVFLVNGFNGLGLHTLFSVIRLFEGVFRNFIFLEVGIVDAGNFKGKVEIDRLERKVRSEVDQYVDLMKRNGYYAEGFSAVGTDVIDEIEQLAPKILERYPNAIFFGGKVVFPEETVLTRFLHNYIIFAVQRKFYHRGLPFVILPIRV